MHHFVMAAVHVGTVGLGEQTDSHFQNLYARLFCSFARFLIYLRTFYADFEP